MVLSWLVNASKRAQQAHSERLLRLVLGGLITFAGIAKVFDLQGFFIGLLELELFDANIARVVSFVVPVAELVVGLWLLIGWQTHWAAAAGFTMLVAFTAALLNAWGRGIEVHCECFGPLSFGTSPLSWFLRNALFLLAFAWLYLRVRRGMARVQTT